MFESLQSWISSVPEALQWLAVMVAAMVPFIDSYEGAFVGVLVGIFPPLAIAAAIVGNTASMLLFVRFGDAILARRQRKAAASAKAEAKQQAKQEKVHRAMDRWGVPGGALLGPFLLPPQFTALAMISFGATRRWVVLWQAISITMWGILFGLLGIVTLSVIGTGA